MRIVLTPQRSRLAIRLLAVPVMAIGLAAAALGFVQPGLGGIATAAWTASGVSLFLALLARVFDEARPRTDLRPTDRASLLRILSLLTAVPALVVLLVVLTIRLVLVSVALLGDRALPARASYGFSSAGLAMIGFLFGAAFVSYLGTRNRRLVTVMFGLALQGVAWASLLAPPLSVGTGGTRARTTISVVGMCAVAAWLGVSSLIHTIALNRRRRGMAPERRYAERFRPMWPGFRLMCGVVAMAMMAMLFYHLAVPLSAGAFGFRATAALCALAACVGTGSMFLLVREDWHPNLVEAGMGLASLALCALMLLLVPDAARALDARYPMIFNALVAGLAASTWCWTMLADRWRTAFQAPHVQPQRLQAAHLAQRLAFLTASLALLLAMLMAGWPRLRSIAATDDSLGRMVAGILGNFLLLLVLAEWSHRHRRPSLYVLTTFAAATMLGFLYARGFPVIPSLG